ncbi:MAG TPA: metal ABC transporter permease [Rhodothermales bacterium]|nr:metal ABC transporter permease [Rhodothermales bacterium]
MSVVQLEIIAVAIVVAVACALPGTYLVLRRMAMLSDAISHAVLPGLVVGFLLAGRVTSPLLMVGAALAGVATAALVEGVTRSGRVREDAAIGLVFPALFALGVVLIARFADRVHLDTDAVLLGELAFVPFDRLAAFGYDLGPRALWIGGGLLALNAAFVGLLRKELALTTFDDDHAATLGFRPALVQMALVVVVSITSVGAFDAVGSVLVVAFFAGPPATALFFARRLSTVLALAAGIAAACALVGYGLARVLDASIAGAMALVVGAAFAGAALFAPEKGLMARRRLLGRQRDTFAARTLAVHLSTHEASPEAETECSRRHLTDHLHWTPAFATRAVERAVRDGWVQARGDRLYLTPQGHAAVASWGAEA